MGTGASTIRTNERPGTRAVLRNLGTSAYKVREVLDLIRGKDVQTAQDILKFCERGPAVPVAKLLASAVANAENNDSLAAEDLCVAACYADEGTTAKRWRPRAKGRAGRIRKRSSHVTIIVATLPEEELERLRSERETERGVRGRRVAGSRRARVAASKKSDADETVEQAETATPEDAAAVNSQKTADAPKSVSEENTEARSDAAESKEES